MCKNNVLNYPNHPGVPPVRGQYYYAHNKGLSVYEGCSPIIQPRGYTQLPSIHIYIEFYVDNHPNESEPLMLSTLCWKSSILLGEGKEEIVEFYTGDIAGQFKVNVQGITESDVISSKLNFKVQ